MIDRIFDELKKPFAADDCMLSITISVGIRIFSEEKDDLEHLIHQADSAMYEAKKSEGCAYIIYQPRGLFSKP